MSRPTMFKDSIVKSVRLEREMDDMLKQIAALESSYSGSKITEMDLIRWALSFCYEDGERLREVFRRNREHVIKRLSRYYRK